MEAHGGSDLVWDLSLLRGQRHCGPGATEAEVIPLASSSVGAPGGHLSRVTKRTLAHTESRGTISRPEEAPLLPWTRSGDKPPWRRHAGPALGHARPALPSGLCSRFGERGGVRRTLAHRALTPSSHAGGGQTPCQGSSPSVNQNATPCRRPEGLRVARVPVNGESTGINPASSGPWESPVSPRAEGALRCREGLAAGPGRDAVSVALGPLEPALRRPAALPGEPVLWLPSPRSPGSGPLLRAVTAGRRDGPNGLFLCESSVPPVGVTHGWRLKAAGCHGGEGHWGHEMPRGAPRWETRPAPGFARGLLRVGVAHPRVHRARLHVSAGWGHSVRPGRLPPR